MYYNLKALVTECINDLEGIGIKVENVTPSDFSVNKRAKSRFGQTVYYWDGTYRNNKKHYKSTINISEFLLDTRNDINSVKETIYHEILHTLDECVGDHHGAKWKRRANQVSKAFGVKITTCGSFDDKLSKSVAEEVERQEMKRKTEYICECANCGTLIRKIAYRAPRWYTATAKYGEDSGWTHTCADGTKSGLCNARMHKMNF